MQIIVILPFIHFSRKRVVAEEVGKCGLISNALDNVKEGEWWFKFIINSE